MPTMPEFRVREIVKVTDLDLRLMQVWCRDGVLEHLPRCDADWRGTALRFAPIEVLIAAILAPLGRIKMRCKTVALIAAAVRGQLGNSEAGLGAADSLWSLAWHEPDPQRDWLEIGWNYGFDITPGVVVGPAGRVHLMMSGASDPFISIRLGEVWQRVRPLFELEEVRFL